MSVDNEVQCIYCRRKGIRFSREHIIPESFGKFGPDTWVLHDMVCQYCNQYFADNLELGFARGSYEAVERIKHGLKPACEGHEIRRDRVTLSVADGEFKGIRLEITAGKDGKPGVRWPPQIGFMLRVKPEREYTLLEELKQFNTIDQQKFDLDSAQAILCIPNSEAEEQELISQLHRLGINFQQKSSIAPPFAAASDLRVEITNKIDRITLRTVAKIVFNYMAKVLGAEYCLRSDFDEVRSFITEDSRMSYPIVTPSNRQILATDYANWRQTGGHLLVLEAINGWRTLIGKISLFNTITYEIVLCRNLSGIVRPINSGHVFDVEAKTIEELVHARRI